MLTFDIGTGARLTVKAVLRNDGNGGTGDGYLTGIRKTGPGEMVLAGVNSFTGASAVIEGTLRIGNASA